MFPRTVELFISSSNNMLYPKENKEDKVLLYAVSIQMLYNVFLLVGWSSMLVIMTFLGNMKFIKLYNI